MAVSVLGGAGFNDVARVLVLDAETNRALATLLRKTLENETYLDANLSDDDIHALKMLGLTVLEESQDVKTPLALWERELLAGADEVEPVVYGKYGA